MVNNENYIVIQGFMVNELKLKGNELLVYAIIYGFSQTEEQKFTGSLKYLSEWTGSTKQGVMKNLKSLVEKGLICKEDKYINGVKFVSYYATKLYRGIKHSLTGGSKHSLPNNIDINNINNNIDIKEKYKKEKFKPPTLEEVQAYCIERNNNIDPKHFIDYYTSNGWKVGKNNMKDWKAAVRTWERNNFSRPAKANTKAEELNDFYNMVSNWAESEE